MQALFHTSTVRRILEELNEIPKFQMPQKLKERKNFLAEAWNTECGEVYSSPRVTQVVSELGLRPAWSLDFNTVDPDDRMPWDFTVAAKRRKVTELISRDKPLLLIACPM